MQLALKVPSEENPISWLIENLRDTLETVASMATDSATEDTLVGRISLSEALEALKSTDADMVQATKMCVESRVDKVRLIIMTS